MTPAPQPCPELKREVHFVCRTQVKEINPTDIIKALETDFTEQREDGHYELPLPFKTDTPNLPDNKQCAVHRLNSLERRLRRNEQYYKRFHTFVGNRIQRIRSSTNPEQWRHVRSENNQASRGLNAAQLKESNWLKGPDFLWQHAT